MALPKLKYVFVSDQRKMVSGDEAKNLIEQKDLVEAKDKVGVVKVSEDRWEEAQNYERNMWLRDALHYNDDRNYQHSLNFGGYENLRPYRFSNALEIGCGPFTNMRLIAGVADVDNIDLLDPLADEYLKHPNCTYRNDRLKVSKYPSSVIRSFRNETQPCRVFSTAFEKFETDKKYDLIVMINVIEHCYDAVNIFDRIEEIAAPDCIFIFHDKLFSDSAIKQRQSFVYDAGHPLLVSRSLVEEYLEKWQPLYQLQKFHPSKNGEEHKSYEGVYFIGKRGNPSLAKKQKNHIHEIDRLIKGQHVFSKRVGRVNSWLKKLF